LIVRASRVKKVVANSAREPTDIVTCESALSDQAILFADDSNRRFAI